MSSGAVSLRDLKDKITSVRATELERRIGSTIMDSYRSVIGREFLEKICESRGERAIPHNISLPTLGCYCGKAAGLREELIALYNKKMGSVPGFDTIPDDVKVSQGALLDGLCYVYDMRTDSVTLGTMNLDILYDLNVETNMQKQIISKNKEGLCKAYRIDVEYINGDKEFRFKATNARNYDIDDAKNDWDPTKNFVLVPYTAGVQLMKICEDLLNRGMVLRVDQAVEGTSKLRFLTTNRNVLNAFCDTPASLDGVDNSFFPLASYFYAPTLGASSLTAMVSRVSLFNVESINLANDKQIKAAGISKCENPVRDLFGERFFISSMLELKKNSPEQFESVIKNLSNFKKIVKDPEKVDRAALSSYLHSVSKSAVEKAYRLADVEDQLNKVTRYLSGKIRPMTSEELQNLEETLKNEVCKFTIRKKDCSIGSILGTTNKSMLHAVYGRGIVRYEGFGYRFYKLESALKDLYASVKDGKDCSVGSEVWRDTVQEYIDYAVSISQETYCKLCEEAKVCDEKVFLNKAKAYAYEESGVSLSRSESASKAAEAKREAGILQCKSLTATIENGKSEDFYRDVDPSKIISAWVLEWNK